MLNYKVWLITTVLAIQILLFSACTGSTGAPQGVGVTSQPVATANVAQAVERPEVATNTPAEGEEAERENMAAEQKLFFVKEGSLG